MGPASYKSNVYEDWLKKTKHRENNQEPSDGEDKSSNMKQYSKKSGFKVLGSTHNFKEKGNHKMLHKSNQHYSRHERKSKDEILKQRKVKAKKEANMKKRKGKKGN